MFLYTYVQFLQTKKEKLMYIPNDDTQNYPVSRSELVVETFEHSTE